MASTITVDQLARALPANLKGAATQSLADQLNTLALDPEVADNIRENFISYTKVLQDGRFKTEDYLNAVKYVSFKLMNYSNQDAYFRTFPQRHAALVSKGADAQTISAHVSMYAKGKLVNLIMEQTLVPSWVLNQDLHQQAINSLAREMNTAPSAMVRVTAATALINALQKPKEVGPLINIDARETSGVNELKDMLNRLAKQQLDLIQGGVPTKEIAGQRIINAEAEITPMPGKP